jgi:16S rRNA G966 N2-methylase RsmD
MSRLPINLPSAAPLRPARNRVRDAVFFCISFAAVFGAALLVMEMWLG